MAMISWILIWYGWVIFAFIHTRLTGQYVFV